jgi:hypothetical protein
MAALGPIGGISKLCCATPNGVKLGREGLVRSLFWMRSEVLSTFWLLRAFIHPSIEMQQMQGMV